MPPLCCTCSPYLLRAPLHYRLTALQEFPREREMHSVFVWHGSGHCTKFMSNTTVQSIFSLSPGTGFCAHVSSAKASAKAVCLSFFFFFILTGYQSTFVQCDGFVCRLWFLAEEVIFDSSRELPVSHVFKRPDNVISGFTESHEASAALEISPKCMQAVSWINLNPS